MKVLWLSPHWLGDYLRSTYTGPGVVTHVRYDREKLPATAFDLTICVGLPGATPDLSRLRSYYRICLVPEGGDKVWEPSLAAYDEQRLFNLVVNIDGNPVWPGAERNLTLLTPIDPAPFTPKPWEKRDIFCGFSGGIHGGRKFYHAAFPEVTWRAVTDPVEQPYEDFAAFLSRCKFVLNLRSHDDHREHRHVKGRVLEAALAGACLIEPKGTCTAEWFKAGEDYLRYDTPAELKALLASPPEEAERIAQSLAAKVRERHSPDAFWQTVLRRIA